LRPIVIIRSPTHLRLRPVGVVSDQVGADLDVGAVDNLGLGVALPDPGDEAADCCDYEVHVSKKDFELCLD
jgi:hypothetical protein